MAQLTETLDDIQEQQNEHIQVLKLTQTRGGIQLKAEEFDIDSAVIYTFLNGLTLVCNQERYSDDELKKYTRKYRT